MSVATENAREKAKELRYKKSVAEGFNIYDIQQELEEISSSCDDVRWCINGNEDELIEALDGDEEEAYEFRIMFSELSVEADELNSILGTEEITEYFDMFFAAVAHGAMKLLGFDTYEEDYYEMTRYQQEWAEDEATKKLMRLTKQELIAAARQCFGVAAAILNIRYKYDYLKAAMDVIKGKNHAYLEAIREIEKLYDKASEDEWNEWADSVKKFDQAAQAMPDRAWLE